MWTACHATNATGDSIQFELAAMARKAPHGTGPGAGESTPKVKSVAGHGVTPDIGMVG